jgi:cysteine synthase
MKFTLNKLIGKTPMIDLSKYSVNSKVKIFAKLEGNNPGGSIKDRVAWRMASEASKRGLLRDGLTLVEPTSGNTGIGLAMLAPVFGYKFVAVMSRHASIERIKLLEAYGASVILVDTSKTTTIDMAKEMVRKESDKYLMLDQYQNENNVLAHYFGTGLEVIKDVPDVTNLVVGIGTTGTIVGVSRRLKEWSKNIKVTGLEPIKNSEIQGLRNLENYMPPIFRRELIDEVKTLVDDEAFDLARKLFKNDGLSVGISSGAALWGAVEVSRTIKTGTIVTIFPDRGDRYISTKLFS